MCVQPTNSVSVTRAQDLYREAEPTQPLARLTLTGSAHMKQRSPSGACKRCPLLVVCLFTRVFGRRRFHQNPPEIMESIAETGASMVVVQQSRGCLRRPACAGNCGSISFSDPCHLGTCGRGSKGGRTYCFLFFRLFCLSECMDVRMCHRRAVRGRWMSVVVFSRWCRDRHPEQNGGHQHQPRHAARPVPLRENFQGRTFQGRPEPRGDLRSSPKTPDKF